MRALPALMQAKRAFLGLLSRRASRVEDEGVELGGANPMHSEEGTDELAAEQQANSRADEPEPVHPDETAGSGEASDLEVPAEEMSDIYGRTSEFVATNPIHILAEQTPNHTEV